MCDGSTDCDNGHDEDDDVCGEHELQIAACLIEIEVVTQIAACLIEIEVDTKVLHSGLIH